MTQSFEVRDNRNKSMFRVDDEYLNGYAKLCGINATGVYICICRHADRYQESFPSVELMAERLGISERSVQYAISALKKWNIVSVEKKRSKGGTFMHNTYTLIDKKHWVSKPDANNAGGYQTQMTTSPDANDDIDHLHQVQDKVVPSPQAHTKEAHNKDSAQSTREIPEIIKAFEAINPACSRYYGHKTQRDAAQKLIEIYTFERVIKIITNVLPKSNGLEYVPTITTPLQLLEKYATLEAALRRAQKVETKENVRVTIVNGVPVKT